MIQKDVPLRAFKITFLAVIFLFWAPFLARSLPFWNSPPCYKSTSL